MKKIKHKASFDVAEFGNSFFVPYKLKADVRTMIEEKIKPEKVESLIATVEYISSRVMDTINDENREPNRFPFFDNEFDKDWLLEELEHESIDHIAENSPNRLFSEPVFTSPISGHPGKVSLIISPTCFEPDDNLGNIIRPQ